MKAEIVVTQRATSVFKPKCNVPYAEIEQLNKKLERLKSLGIIEKTETLSGQQLRVCVKKKEN